MTDRLIGIVGAPRCGTTSLSRFLSGHSDVCFSTVKEPHFFSQHELSGLSDDALRSFVETEYLQRYFPGRPNGAACLAEGSVSYLYAPQHMKAVLRLWPDVRFIIAVRDPMEMLPSLHQRLLVTGDETQTDFARAWLLAPLRRQGKYVPRSCIDARWLLYDEIARLGTHVGRFLSAVGRERCFIALYDDLAVDPAQLYRNMLDFLDLRYDGRTDFAARRQSRGYRIGWLQRLLKRPPQVTRGLLAGEKFRSRIDQLRDDRRPSPAIARLIWHGRKRLLRWNSRPAPPVLLSPELQESIRAALRDEIAELSRLTGRNLDHWMTPSGERSDRWETWADPAQLRDAA